ncbi:hypothetical protein OQA88_2384 [Cercophora sp. LCS_1]
MRQKRITEFFVTAAGTTAKPPPTSSFMKAPPSVRMAIYRFAGIKQFVDTEEAFIDLNCWNHGCEPPAVVPSQNSRSGDCKSEDDGESTRLWVNWNSRIPINLLAVSHAIHDEMETALYSSYTWGVSTTGPGGLAPLENLSPQATRAMRCLFVDLTPCSCSGCILTGVCHNPIPVNVRFHISLYGSHSPPATDPEPPWAWGQVNTCHQERPLNVRSRLDARTISQWERVCAKLVQHAEPRRFRLYVRCVVRDIKTAERVAKPLSGFPSSLQELGISFGECTKNPPAPCDEALLSLAKSTVQAATYQPTFPFFDLPAELQLQVLSFSHLITRSFELKYIAGKPLLSQQGGSGSSEQIVAFSQIDGYHAWLLGRVFCAGGNHSNAALKGRCFKCNGPVACFLVSKRFRDLAMELFYGRNHIVVAYNDIRWCTGRANPPTGAWPVMRPPAPLPHVLQHITWLALVASIRGRVDATVDFTYLVGLLGAYAPLPSLTLELHTRDTYGRDEMLAALRGVPPVRGQGRRRRRHAEIYRVIIRHIRERLAVRGLKAFLLYIWWEDFGSETTAGDVAIRRALEREKEREVMGAGYDSDKHGKEQQRRAAPRERIFNGRWY